MRTRKSDATSPESEHDIIQLVSGQPLSGGFAACCKDEMGQVILNMIVNAAHAIKADDSAKKGKIRITTSSDGDYAVISISDTGTGMPPEVKERIFDPFFTTKEVGSGTGQGLSIAYDVVVSKHNGVIDVETREGEGTTFIIKLPLK